MISHRLASAKLADIIYVIKDGVIEEKVRIRNLWPKKVYMSLCLVLKAVGIIRSVQMGGTKNEE